MFEPAVISPTHVDANALLLSRAVLGVGNGPTRTRLHEALSSIQPDPYAWSAGADSPQLQFDRQSGLNEALLRRVMVVDALPEDWQIPEEERPAITRSVDRALGRMAQLDHHMRQSIGLLVGALIFGRTDHYGGGSNSSAIGCIWLSPKATWTDDTWLEHIFHEYVHQALFLDDMLYGLFAEGGASLSSDDALVRSAVLQIPRPYDRAYHSAFVSFAIIQLYGRGGNAAHTSNMVAPLRATIAGLYDKRRYLTDHGLAVLESLRHAFEAAHSQPVQQRA